MIVVSVVAAIAALACLGFGIEAVGDLRDIRHTEGAGRTATAEPTEQTSVYQPKAVSTSSHGAAIKSYVIPRPAGAHATPNLPAEQPLDVTAAALFFHDHTEGKAILERYNFKDGYLRRWVDKNGAYVIVRVFRFDNETDGNDFTNFLILSNIKTWGTPKDVPGLDGAAAFVQSKLDASGFQQSMAVGDGADVVPIVLAEQLPPARASIPEDLLTSEFTLL